MHVAPHGLVPCQSSHLTKQPALPSSIYSVKWPPNTITCSFSNKALQTKTQLSSFQQVRKKETMLSTKRISQMVKKWQRMAVLGRKRLAWRMEREANQSCTSVASKDHCVMYSSDGRRFEVPLAYLGTLVFAELLRMSQEEFGFMSEGRITLPCDAAFMEYAICLLRRGSSTDVEKAFLSTMAVSCH